MYEKKISIIMPVYNSGMYLCAAIKSILNQDFKNFELILVDDGSTDGSSKVCDEYAKKDPRIVVIHQNNGGICAARNAGLNVAKGIYIAFADHDDEYLPGLLKNAYSIISRTRCDVVKFGMREETIKNGIVNKIRIYNHGNHNYSQEDIKNNFMNLLLDGLFDFIWDGLYKRHLISKNELRFDTFFKRGGEDISFMLDLVQRNITICTLENIYYKHYVREGISASSLEYEKKNDETFEVKKKEYETIKVLNIDMKSIKNAYTFHLVESYINMLIVRYARQENPYTKETYAAFDSFREKPFLPDYFLKGYSFDVFKYSTKYGLIYFLYKHRRYRWLLFVYKLRQKCKNRIMKYPAASYGVSKPKTKP